MTEARQIVFIMTDTQRADIVGCYGRPEMKTPSLDRLAAEGVRFDRAYTCVPVCGPARAALFTGLHCHSNGVLANSMAPAANVKTLGQRMRDRGFHTAYVGKWHLDGGDYFGTGKCPDGWDADYWYDMKRYMEELSPADRTRSRQFETSPQITEDFTFAHRCSNRAVDFLDKHAAEDFLLVVSYDEPHGPCLCPPPWCDMFKGYEFPKSPNIWDRLDDKPEHLRLWAGKKGLSEDKDAKRIDYRDRLGCNAFVDYEIGRVLAAVDRAAPDALVVYTSDHGDMLYSHGLTKKGPAMFDEITRVPFIVRWPRHVAAGGVCPYPVSHIDVVPTIMEAAGLSVPKWLDGQSLVPTLANPDTRQNDAIFMEFNRFEINLDFMGGFQPIRCVFDGRFKLVVNLLDTDELYDLAADPSEMKNLIDSAEHAPIRDALHERLLGWMDDTRDTLRGYCWARRPWRTDAKRDGWYGSAMARDVDNEEYEDRALDYETGLPVDKATRPQFKHGKPAG